MDYRQVQLIGGPHDGKLITTNQLEVRFPIFDMRIGMTEAVYRLDRITEHGFIARFVEETFVD